MSPDEQLLLQTMLKSIDETHHLLHNLIPVATASLNRNPAAADNLQKTLKDQLTSAQQLS